MSTSATPAGRITERAEGAPFQPGDAVRVVAAVDANAYDVSAHVGASGQVVYLEYDCGCGQRYPADPMIGVDLGGVVEEFWPEELARGGQ